MRAVCAAECGGVRTRCGCEVERPSVRRSARVGEDGVVTAMRAVPLRSPRADAAAVQVLRHDGTRHLIAMRASVPLAQDATVWLPALVPVAMATGEDLEIAGDVDPVSLVGAVQAQRLLARWFPQWRAVAIRAETGVTDPPAPRDSVTGTSAHGHSLASPATRAADAPPAVEDSSTAPTAADRPRPQPLAATELGVSPALMGPADAVGCFFSAGVDSTYAALSPQVTHLIYVRGFDEPLHGGAGAHATSEHVRSVAAVLGKPLIEVDTDVRTTLDRYAPWGHAAHGPAMATVALALRDHFATVVFPGAWPVDQTPVWGTHPHLDPLWSSSQLRVVNDSTRLGRVDKVRALARRPELLAGLRVCWQNSGKLNCGDCEKCLRTMVSLYAVGALGEARLFPSRVDAERVAELPGGEVASFFARENLDALRQMPAAERDYALETAVARLADAGPGPG